MVFNSCTIPQTVGADSISARPMPSPSSVACGDSFPLQGKPFALLSCQHLQSTTNL